jgi:APA family basic amino acid/polyamine antiporter
MFAIKDIIEIQREAAAEGAGGLKRVLGPWQLIALGIGCIIGAGIFVMTGEAAQHAGPALVLSFILGAVACGFAGLCYAELASVIPVSGSAYTYSYATLGEIIAWVVGWCLILEYGVASSAVAVGWSGYFVSFLRDWGLVISPVFTQPFGTEVTLADGTVTTSLLNAPAFVAMMVVTGILMLGVKESTSLNNIMVIIKSAVIVSFIAIGAFYIVPENWVPFIPLDTLPDGTETPRYSGIVAGAGLIFFAYIGFDAVSTAAQEAKNPQRDMPFGILGSLVICTILYMAVAAVMTGVVDYKALAVPDPIAVAVDAMKAADPDSVLLSWLVPVVKIGAITGLFSVMLVCTYSQIRINFVMARDGLLPKIFSEVNEKTHTPVKNTLICGLVIASIAAFVPLHALGTLVSMGTLIAFSIVCVGVIYLRKTQPDLPRPFRTPLVPFVPLGGILACAYLISGLPWATLEHFAIWLALGIAIYFLYGYTRSQLHEPAKDFALRKPIGVLALLLVLASPLYYVQPSELEEAAAAAHEQEVLESTPAAHEQEEAPAAE